MNPITLSPGCVREKDVRYVHNYVSSHVVENEKECAMLSASTQQTKEKGLFGNDGALFWTFYAHGGTNSERCTLSTERKFSKHEKKSWKGDVSGNSQCGKY